MDHSKTFKILSKRIGGGEKKQMDLWVMENFLSKFKAGK